MTCGDSEVVCWLCGEKGHTATPLIIGIIAVVVIALIVVGITKYLNDHEDLDDLYFQPTNKERLDYE